MAGSAWPNGWGMRLGMLFLPPARFALGGPLFNTNVVFLSSQLVCSLPIEIPAKRNVCVVWFIDPAKSNGEPNENFDTFCTLTLIVFLCHMNLHSSLKTPLMSSYSTFSSFRQGPPQWRSLRPHSIWERISQKW